MQRDQVVAWRLQVGHLVDRLIAARRHAAGREGPRPLGYELAARAEDVLGLGCAPLHDPDDAR